jgi:hypothetical protein
MNTNAKIISDFYRENWLAGMLLTRIRKAHGWSLRLDNGYPDWDFFVVFLSPSR